MGKSLIITEDQAERRLDRFLRAMWPQVPLGAIMKAIRKGEVRIDGSKAAVDTRLEEGQVLQVPWDDDVRAGAIACRHVGRPLCSLETLYKDDYVWIVNKPAGLLTQPDIKGGDSLITRALAELGWSRRDFVPATVQRLDRNTSGIVMIAMSGPSLRHLSELIRDRAIKKIYRAVVEGDIDSGGEINLPLIKDASSNTVKIATNGGEPALTRYRKLGKDAAVSAVEVELVTGRSHQARVHLASIGHPIAGDRKYGSKMRFKRPLLHAYSLVFPNDALLPESLRGKMLIARIPDDMAGYFARCRDS